MHHNATVDVHKAILPKISHPSVPHSSNGHWLMPNAFPLPKMNSQRKLNPLQV